MNKVYERAWRHYKRSFKPSSNPEVLRLAKSAAGLILSEFKRQRAIMEHFNKTHL